VIKSIKVRENADEFPCYWWKKVKQLEKVDSFSFENGLNVLLGPNGSGKSTVVRTIARMFFAEQGGRITFTQSAFSELYRKNVCTSDSFYVEHDGGPVFYLNQSDTVGLVGGQFDDDFFIEGITATVNKYSSGEKSIVGIHRAFSLVNEYYKKFSIVDDKLGNCNSYYMEKKKAAIDFLKPSVFGIPVLILDEPEAGLDLFCEMKMWESIRKVAKKIQVIVCSHSIFALESEANFIETEEGYRAKCLTEVEKLRGTKKPRKPRKPKKRD
jgi:energy-coupling factor transporter ATP-binding protein EcfA2